MADGAGFVGYGSMGGMLARGLAAYCRDHGLPMVATRKDRSRLDEIRGDCPGITIANDAAEVARSARILFLCVKPLEYPGVLREIRPCLTPEHHLVSIAGAVRIADIERIVDARITKIMPSVLAEVRAGVIPVCHNRRVSDGDAESIERMLGTIGRVYRLEERDFGLVSEYTSCGPGLYAAILREMVAAGVRSSDRFSADDLAGLATESVLGTARLLLEKGLDFSGVIDRVATRGGITAEGVRVLQAGLPAVFDEMLAEMAARRAVMTERARALAEPGGMTG